MTFNSACLRLSRFPAISWVAPFGRVIRISRSSTNSQLSTGVLASSVLVLIYYRELAESLPLQLYLPVLLFVLAMLMVSRLRFPKATVRDNRFINVFQIVNIILIFYCGITRSYPEYLLGIAIVLMVGGIIAGRISRQRQTQAEAE